MEENGTKTRANGMKPIKREVNKKIIRNKACLASLNQSIFRTRWITYKGTGKCLHMIKSIKDFSIFEKISLIISSHLCYHCNTNTCLLKLQSSWIDCDWGLSEENSDY